MDSSLLALIEQMGMHVLNLQHRCHSSYAQKDAPEATGGGDSVKISTLGQPCCRFMPLTLPSMRLRLKGRRGSKAQSPEVDAAEWINRVVKDPMVEIDPVTMALARKYYALVAPSGAAPGVVESNSPSPVMETISTSQQPFSHFAMAPRRFGSVLGLAIALASLTAAVHLFRMRKLEGIARQQEPQPLTYASSDEEAKLDLLSIVEQDEPAAQIISRVAQQGPEFIDEVGAISLKPEVAIAAAAAAVETMKQRNAAANLVQQAVAAAQVISKVEPPGVISPKPEVPAAEVQAAVAAPPPPQVISPKLEVVKAPAAEVQAAVAAPPPPQVISHKPEVVKAPAAEVQAAVAAPPPPQVISRKPEVVKAPAAEVQAAVAAPPPPQFISPKLEVVKAPAAEVKVEQEEPPQVIPKPEVVKAAAETIEVQEAVAAAQVMGKVEQKEQPHGVVSPKPGVVIAAAAQAIELEKSVEAEINDEGHVNKVVITDVVVDKRIAMTGASAAQEVNSMATSNKRQEHASSAANPVPFPHSTAAPKNFSSNNNMDRLSVPLDHPVHSNSKNLSDHFFKNSYLTSPSFDTKNFMEDRSSSRTGDAGKDDLQDETTQSSSSSSEEDEMIYDKEKRESLKKVVQAAAPAMAVGAGALSVLTGVDGAFEMVGLAATASFISFELLWADAREELWREVKKISDHRKLLEFFKARKIIQDDI